MSSDSPSASASAPRARILAVTSGKGGVGKTFVSANLAAALARRGELERTLVVITSDHGEMLGDHWMLGKAGFFPQAFHVPLLVRLPDGARRSSALRSLGAFANVFAAESLVDDIAAACGDDRDAALDYLNSPRDVAEVADLVHEVGRQGIGGVPFFIIDRRLAVSGAQPAAALVEALLQAARPA